MDKAPAPLKQQFTQEINEVFIIIIISRTTQGVASVHAKVEGMFCRNVL